MFDLGINWAMEAHFGLTILVDCTVGKKDTADPANAATKFGFIHD